MNTNLVKGVIFFTLYCFITACSNTLIKLATMGHVSNITVLFWQYLIALVLLLPFVLGKSKAGFKTQKLHWLIFRGAAGFGTMYCFIRSVSLISLSMTTLLLFSAPLWVLLLSRIFLKEKIIPRAILGLIIGFIGIALSLAPSSSQSTSTLGLFLAALGGLLFAVVLLVSQKLNETEPHARVLLYYFLVSLVMIGIFFFPELHFNNLNQIAVIDWVYIACIGLAQVLSLGCMLIAYQYATASKLAALNYSVIFFTSILEYALWKTFIPESEYLGASFIFIGLLLSLNSSQAKKHLTHKEENAHESDCRIS
jgi:drug/metabolite transporter (DMT)-like permease